MTSLFPQKDMRPLDISVCKGENRYLIIPYDYSVAGYQVGSKRHISLPDDISAEEMGNQLLKALEIIKKSPLDTRFAKQRDDDFSKLTGFSTYARFAKKYDCVAFLLMKDDGYCVEASAKKIKGSGAGWCGERIVERYLPCSATAAEIGDSIFGAFEMVETFYRQALSLKKEKKEFETTSKHIISYHEPSDDHYADEQDFHIAEVYQGYSFYKDGTEDLLANMYFGMAAELNNEISKENVHDVYTRLHGKSIEYDMKAIKHPIFQYRFDFLTRDVRRILYIRRESEAELLSCELVLKKKTAGKRLHDKIVKDFEAMAKSCREEKR